MAGDAVSIVINGGTVSRKSFHIAGLLTSITWQLRSIFILVIFITRYKLTVFGDLQNITFWSLATFYCFFFKRWIKISLKQFKHNSLKFCTDFDVS